MLFRRLLPVQSSRWKSTSSSSFSSFIVPTTKNGGSSSIATESVAACFSTIDRCSGGSRILPQPSSSSSSSPNCLLQKQQQKQHHPINNNTSPYVVIGNRRGLLLSGQSRSDGGGGSSLTTTTPSSFALQIGGSVSSVRYLSFNTNNNKKKNNNKKGGNFNNNSGSSSKDIKHHNHNNKNKNNNKGGGGSNHNNKFKVYLTYTDGSDGVDEEELREIMEEGEYEMITAPNFNKFKDVVMEKFVLLDDEYAGIQASENNLKIYNSKIKEFEVLTSIEQVQEEQKRNKKVFIAEDYPQGVYDAHDYEDEIDYDDEYVYAGGESDDEDDDYVPLKLTIYEILETIKESGWKRSSSEDDDGTSLIMMMIKKDENGSETTKKSTKEIVLDIASKDKLLQSKLLNKIGALDHIVECLHYDFVWNSSKDSTSDDDDDDITKNYGKNVVEGEIVQ